MNQVDIMLKEVNGLQVHQEQVEAWIKTLGAGYFPIHEQLACLTEEVGEIARVINNQYRTKKKKESDEQKELGSELVDALFAIVCIANSTGVNLEESWQKLVEQKLYKRDKDRFKKEELQ